MGKIIDLTGQVFGRLTVLTLVGRNKHRQTIWECMCACGAVLTAAKGDLVSGHTKSCGCLKIDTSRASLTKHGTTTWKGKKPKLYSIWCDIRSRCNRTSHRHYKDYGGRGITMCPEWDNYALFQEYVLSLGEKPSESHSLDRVDNSKGYCPDNLRWADKTEQSMNRRNTKVVTCNGETKSISEWGACLGVPAQTIRNRLRKGWPVSLALSKTHS